LEAQRASAAASLDGPRSQGSVQSERRSSLPACSDMALADRRSSYSDKALSERRSAQSQRGSSGQRSMTSDDAGNGMAKFMAGSDVDSGDGSSECLGDLQQARGQSGASRHSASSCSAPCGRPSSQRQVTTMSGRDAGDEDVAPRSRSFMQADAICGRGSTASSRASRASACSTGSSKKVAFADRVEGDDQSEEHGDAYWKKAADSARRTSSIRSSASSTRVEMKPGHRRTQTPYAFDAEPPSDHGESGEEDTQVMRPSRH